MTDNTDDLSKHIFQHYNYTYVVDFANKRCFVIDSEDDIEPVVMLDIKKNPNGWVYKSSGLTEDAPFIEDTDEEWANKMNCKYMEYIKTLVINNQVMEVK